MNLIDLYDICSDDWSLLAFLQHFNLILCDRECCSRKCKLFKRKDSFIFKCIVRGCGNTFTVSPKGYWFSNVHLSYKNSLLIMYLFCMESSVTHVRVSLDISNKTVIDWFNFCREVCVLCSLESNTKIGGPDKEVEIYESVFGKRKYHRGRFEDCKWVLGGIERNSNKSFLVPIEKRDSKILCDIIQLYVTPGTIIITDSWEGYKDLKQHDCHHLTVNHSITFKDSTTVAHTNNTIEGTWAQVEFQIPCRGRRKQHLAGYLATYMYFKKYEEHERFIQFLSDISRFYP